MEKKRSLSALNKMLAMARKKSGLTYPEIREKCGVSWRMAWKMENDPDYTPKPENLRRIATCHDICFTDLMVAAGHIQKDEIVIEKRWLDEDREYLVSMRA